MGERNHAGDGVGHVKRLAVLKGLADDQGERDLALGELHIEMRAAEIPIEHRDQLLGIDEFDAVIAPEMAMLVVKPVGIADRMALLEVNDERPLAIGGAFRST